MLCLSFFSQLRFELGKIEFRELWATDVRKGGMPKINTLKVTGKISATKTNTKFQGITQINKLYRVLQKFFAIKYLYLIRFSNNRYNLS